MKPLNELKVAVPPPASWLKVPPFGRGGIDVFQMFEIGRIAQIVESGQAVMLGLAGGLRRTAKHGGAHRDRAGAQDQDVTSRKIF